MEIQKLRDGMYRLSTMHEGITLSVHDLRDIHDWVEAHKVELDKEELERIERELGQDDSSEQPPDS
jgi:hypothetical protein